MNKTFEIVLLASVVLGGCNDRPEDEDITQSHNVIAVLPLTGSFAGKGPEHLKAIQLGFGAIEEAGGVDKPIRVFVIDAANNTPLLPDDVCELADSRTACRLAAKIDELTIGNTRHIAAIFSSTTGAMKIAAPTALVDGIPFFEISSGSGLDEVTLKPEADRTYSFALRPLCMPEPDVTADLIAARASTPGWESIQILRGNQAHDKMHARELRTSMTTRGQAARIVGADVEMPNDGPFEPHIDAAIAAGAKVIYFHLNGDAPNLKFMQAAERQGFTGKLVTCGMARRKELIHPTDPGIAPYLSNNNSTTEGRLFFAMRGPISSPSYDAFVQDFKTFSGYDADTFSPSGYDGAVLIGLGIAAAGSSEKVALRQAIADASVGGTKFTYGQVAEALAAAKRGEDIDLDGASGDLDLKFDPVRGPVLGNVAVGRYYFDTVIKSADFKYQPLPTPIDVR